MPKMLVTACVVLKRPCTITGVASKQLQEVRGTEQSSRKLQIRAFESEIRGAFVLLFCIKCRFPGFKVKVQQVLFLHEKHHRRNRARWCFERSGNGAIVEFSAEVEIC